MKLLEGKTAIVTGASRGIGRAVALAMAAQGAAVGMLYANNDAAAQAIINDITAANGRAVAIKCDVSKLIDVKSAVTEIASSLGSPEILVNNAGVVKDRLLLMMKEEDFDGVIAVNLKGAFNLIKSVLPYMQKNRCGRIINISSVSGLHGNAGQANYSASKAGLIGLTKSVAKEAGSRGVTCNALAPGFIETDMTSGLPSSVREAALSAIPLKRFGLPDDVAAAAVFLASEYASFITGEVIKIDGGMCM